MYCLPAVSASTVLAPKGETVTVERLNQVVFVLKRILTVVPAPVWLVISISQPKRSHILFTRFNPSPVPPALVV